MTLDHWLQEHYSSPLFLEGGECEWRRIDDCTGGAIVGKGVEQ